MGLAVDDAAWAAGFLDGEGHFTFRTAGRHLQTFAPVVTASQASDRSPIDKLHSCLGGSTTANRRRTVTGREVFMWTWLSARLMRERLPLLLPHMTARKAQASIVLAYVQRMRIRGEPNFSAPLSQDEIQWRAEQVDALKALKRK